VFAHVPMILGPDGAKLSKRHGAVSVLQYRQEGYLPEALLNYLVRLGWSHGDQEIFSLDEMIAMFDIGDVNKSASSFNPEKLMWLNQHYIKEAKAARLAIDLQWQLERLGVDTSSGPPLEAIAEAYRERAKTLHEMAQASLFFFQDFEAYHDKAARQHLGPDAAEPLRRVRGALANLLEWNAQAIHTIVQEVADVLELKMGKVAQPLRVAVSGGPVSPPIDVTVALLGKDTTLMRLDRALAYSETRPADSGASTGSP
jgi:glutamyl-tRNA synthetase